MPFGLKNAGAAYSRMVQNLVRMINHPGVVAYLDDILLHTSNLEQHLRLLDQVLCQHAKFGLKLRPEKTKLLQDHADYLGYRITEAGIQLRQDYVEKISKWPLPQTPKMLASALGFFSYYRESIPKFSELCARLNEQKNKKRLEWTPQLIQDWEKLKGAFLSSPVLQRRGHIYTFHRFQHNRSWRSSEPGTKR